MHQNLTPVIRSGPVGRYAPSPTGRLHLGNLHTAIEAYRQIRDKSGIFILRMEDTDLPRNVRGSAEQIISDLKWLGIKWDEGPDVNGPAGPYNQSQRSPIYEQALHLLAARGLLYPCTCSRKDLQSAASAPHNLNNLVYPGTCRPTDPPDKCKQFGPAFLSRFLAAPWQQRGACLRLRTDAISPVEFTDELHGLQTHDLARESGDFVILRRDGLWAYQFVCAIDDSLMGITHVLRGNDLLSSTPRQVAIIVTLGYTVPIYRHIPLLLDAHGNRMSKRDGSTSLRNLQKHNLSPQQVREAIKSLAHQSRPLDSK